MRAVVITLLVLILIGAVAILSGRLVVLDQTHCVRRGSVSLSAVTVALNPIPDSPLTGGLKAEVALTAPIAKWQEYPGLRDLKAAYLLVTAFCSITIAAVVLLLLHQCACALDWLCLGSWADDLEIGTKQEKLERTMLFVLTAIAFTGIWISWLMIISVTDKETLQKFVVFVAAACLNDFHGASVGEGILCSAIVALLPSVVLLIYGWLAFGKVFTGRRPYRGLPEEEGEIPPAQLSRSGAARCGLWSVIFDMDISVFAIRGHQRWDSDLPSHQAEANDEVDDNGRLSLVAPR
jgi:hypothetical protein